MKSQEIIIKERKALAEGLQELIELINDNTVTVTEELKVYLYSGFAMIRVMDWSLDDSELDFDKYALKTNENIMKEFDFEKIGDKLQGGMEQ